MLRIGITGGIGSGKSTVSRIFHMLDIPVFDADAVAKDIMNEDKDVQKQLIQNFGKDVFTNRTLNRKYLSDIVFNNEGKLKTLNAIVHPATIRAASNWMKKQTAPYAMKEAALLFEANTVNDLDAVIGVFAPVEMRISRVMQRNNVSREQVLERMNKQMNEEEKMALCDYVVYNDEQQLLISQILDLHKKFTQY
ncbi:MAG TPA: dephospho-CoA kinase [Arachidicoccus sp.]